ncbi:MAG: hypothetical protein KGL39_16650 [Patescibacteria group bacterium]|nr:hypothetical protein [Patescibacteria group bacterium]
MASVERTIKYCLTTAVALLVACGGGGKESVEVRVAFSSEREWNMPTDGTSIILPGRIQNVRLGSALKDWGIHVDGDTIQLTCMYIPLDAHHPEIPAPAEMWVLIEQ